MIPAELLNEAAQAVAGTDWDRANQAAFVERHLEALVAFVAESPVAQQEIADAAAERAERAAQEAAQEAVIAEITGGLDRETVMALAQRALHDARGFWPSVEGGTLVVRNTSDEEIRWAQGDAGWSSVIDTQGTRDDTGAGFGMN